MYVVTKITSLQYYKSRGAVGRICPCAACKDEGGRFANAPLPQCQEHKVGEAKCSKKGGVPLSALRIPGLAFYEKLPFCFSFLCSCMISDHWVVLHLYRSGLKQNRIGLLQEEDWPKPWSSFWVPGVCYPCMSSCSLSIKDLWPLLETRGSEKERPKENFYYYHYYYYGLICGLMFGYNCI